MTEKKSDAEVLKEVRNLIANGWVQHTATDNMGRYCLVGAIGVAIGWPNISIPDETSPYRAEDRDRLEAKIAKVIKPEAKFWGDAEPFDGKQESAYHAVTAFNDAVDTTQDDVLAIIDAAIENEETSE